MNTNLNNATDELVETYILHYGYECDFDGSVCNNKVECNDCEKQWEECYEITSRFDVDGKLIDTFETYCNKENA